MNTRRLLSVAACAVVFMAPANASLTDALESMYMVTGNEPGIYQSQRRLGFDAGYMRLRTPVSTYQVFNYSAPRLEAGCGGIDMYGGSFSFINLSEFTQMLRQIGANALGYAFKLALASICGICDSVLGDLGRALQELNALQVDTCKWGQGLAVGTAEALGFEIDEKYKLSESNMGTFADPFRAAREIFSDRHVAMSGGDPTGADPNNLAVGNITWNALNESDSASALTFPSANGLDNIELLLNIAGTVILRGPSDDDVTDGNEGRLVSILPQTLTYEYFKDGIPQSTADNQDWTPLKTCEGDRCLTYGDLAEWGLEEGVQGWVRGRLQAAADHMADPATAGTDHPADLQVFLASVPFTLMRHLQELQGDRAGLDQYVELMTPYITEFYVPHLALMFVKMIEQAYTHPEIPEVHTSVRANLDRFRDSALVDMREANRSYGHVVFQAEDLIERRTKTRGDPGGLMRGR